MCSLLFLRTTGAPRSWWCVAREMNSLSGSTRNKKFLIKLWFGDVPVIGDENFTVRETYPERI